VSLDNLVMLFSQVQLQRPAIFPVGRAFRTVRTSLNERLLLYSSHDDRKIEISKTIDGF